MKENNTIHKALYLAAFTVFTSAFDVSDLGNYDEAYRKCGDWAALRKALEASKKELNL